MIKQNPRNDFDTKFVTNEQPPQQKSVTECFDSSREKGF